MKKNTKKLCVVLTLCLLASLFAACGNTAAQSSAPDISTGSSAEESASQDAQSESQSEPPSIEEVTIYVLSESFAGDAAVQEEVEKQIADTIGLKFNIVCSLQSDHWDRLNVAMASGKPIDAFSEGTNLVSNWSGKPEFIADISKEFEQYGQDIRDNVTDLAIKQVTFGGQMIAIPNDNLAAQLGILIRTDILNKYNIPIPSDLASLEAAMAALKEADPNILPMAGSWWTLEPLLCMLDDRQYSGTYVIDEEAQRITHGYYTDEAYPFVNRLVDWKEKGWFDRDHLVNQSNPEFDQQGFASGRIPIITGGYGTIKPYVELTLEGNPDATFAFITELAPGKGQWSYSGSSNMVLVVTKQCKVPDRLVQYVNWMTASKENHTLVRDGMPGVNYKIHDAGGIQSIEVLQAPEAQKVAFPMSLGLFYKSLWYDKYLDESMPAPLLEAQKLTEQALKQLEATAWKTDPTYGVVALDKSIEAKYPLAAATALGNDFFAGKLLTGQIPADEDAAATIAKEYDNAGGKEVSEEYWRQYKEQGN